MYYKIFGHPSNPRHSVLVLDYEFRTKNQPKPFDRIGFKDLGWLPSEQKCSNVPV